VKHNHGRQFWLLMAILLSMLHAEDFLFDAHTDISDPYVKEGVLLSIDLNQTNHDIVLLFNFDLKPSPDYTFQRIDSKESDSYHNAKVRYLYLLYPLRSGKISIGFDLIKRVTNDESVAYSFSGDRDNVKGLVTQNTRIDLPPLQLNVKTLPRGINLVGDFSLTYKLEKTEAAPYEPIPFQVTIKGKGYPPLFKSLIPQSTSFTLFLEKPLIQTSHASTGTQSTITYPMALSSDKDFTLPALALHAFDPKTERQYTLKVPATDIHIIKNDVNTLIDTIDTPPPLHTDWQWLTTLFGYLMAFGAGFTTAWVVKWQRKHPFKETIDPLAEKIDACKEKKALLQLLLAHDTARFSSVIDALEADLYGKKSTSLTTLKQHAKEQLI